MGPVLSVEDLVKAHGSSFTLGPVSFEVSSGHVLGLLGPNGAGKTTTVRSTLGLTARDAGRVSLSGVDLQPAALLPRGKVSVLFDANIVPEPRWSARRYLRYMGRLVGLHRSQLDDAIVEASEALSFAKYLDRPIRDLSGGNQRKVELARALLSDSQLYVLDEPTREMDIPSKRMVWDVILERRQRGGAVLLASHDAREIEYLCDDAVILHEGRIVARASLPALRDADVNVGEWLEQQMIQGSIADQGGARFRVVRSSDVHDLEDPDR